MIIVGTTPSVILRRRGTSRSPVLNSQIRRHSPHWDTLLRRWYSDLGLWVTIGSSLYLGCWEELRSSLHYLAVCRWGSVGGGGHHILAWVDITDCSGRSGIGLCVCLGWRPSSIVTLRSDGLVWWRQGFRSRRFRGRLRYWRSLRRGGSGSVGGAGGFVAYVWWWGGGSQPCFCCRLRV